MYINYFYFPGVLIWINNGENVMHRHGKYQQIRIKIPPIRIPRYLLPTFVCNKIIFMLLRKEIRHLAVYSIA